MERSAPDAVSEPSSAALLPNMDLVVTTSCANPAGGPPFLFERLIKSDGLPGYVSAVRAPGREVTYKIYLHSRVNVQILLDALRLKRGEPRGFLLPPGALSSSWAYVPHADSSPLPRAVAEGETELKALLVAWAVGGAPSSEPTPSYPPDMLVEVSKHNCWSCRSWREVIRNSEREMECWNGSAAVEPWLAIHIPRGAKAPSRNADGCPGWKLVQSETPLWDDGNCGPSAVGKE